MIFVDTGFFFALSAAEEKARHAKARELLDTLQDRTLSDVLITTDHVVFETLTLIQTTVDRNAHARAVQVGEQLYNEKLARIYRVGSRSSWRPLRTSASTRTSATARWTA